MIKGFKKPTQEELDQFYERSYHDPEIMPYLSLSRWHSKKEVPKDDWDGLMYISDCGKCLLWITMQRSIDLEFEVGLFSKSSYLAGKAVKLLLYFIEIYKPTYINTTVHASNKKSVNINRLIFGDPWGIEEKGCWDFGQNKRVDLLYFRATYLNVLELANRGYRRENLRAIRNRKNK